LVGTWPSRTQLHRWLAGDLKGLPYPDHCRVLEGMFPGWSAAQLFEPMPEHRNASGSSAVNSGRLLDIIDAGLSSPTSFRGEWRSVAKTGEEDLPSGHVDNGSFPSRDEVPEKIGRKLLALSKIQRLSVEDTRGIAGLAGNVVELELGIDFDIAADGWANVSYHHELFNMSDKPVARIAREIWFEQADRLIK